MKVKLYFALEDHKALNGFPEQLILNLQYCNMTYRVTPVLPSGQRNNLTNCIFS